MSRYKRSRLLIMVAPIMVFAALVAALVMAPGQAHAATSYVDVPTSHWGYSNIVKAGDAGFMTGDREGNTFRPDDGISRAEVVTALWKEAGKPKPAQAASFNDLTAQWYKDAIGWANENGIAEGYAGSNNFGPDHAVTREQFATFTSRYVDFVGNDTTVTDSSAFDKMPDKGTVSGYAADSVKWAMEQKIITGLNGNVAPNDGATRAMVATMMVRTDEAGLFDEPDDGTVVVPSVIGMNSRDAGAKLLSYGLRGLESAGHDGNMPLGVVVKQSPEAGTVVKKGSEVQFFINQ